jgi:hypothetical protein
LDEAVTSHGMALLVYAALLACEFDCLFHKAVVFCHEFADLMLKHCRSLVPR